MLEEVTGCRAHATRQAGGGDMFLRDRFDDRQIETGAGKMWVSLGNFNAEETRCAADIAERPEVREVEFFRERLEVDAREAGHRAHELFQPWKVRIEFLKHPLLPMLNLILRPARP